MKIPQPDIGLLCKLGSIAVHADEFVSPSGHAYDLAALKGLLQDPDVKEFIAAMQKAALVPVKR